MFSKLTRFHRPWGAFFAGVVLGANFVHADITYLDAVAGPSGNTFATGGTLEDTSWIDPDTGSGLDNEQWKIRPFGNNGSLMQALHAGNTLPELTTEITGLTDGTYEVWIFFWDGPNSNQWTISSGLTPGSLATYSFDGPGNTTAPVASSTLTFTNAIGPITTEDPRIMYGVLLGQVAVTGGTPIKVYVDNLAGNSSNNRTWYDGVGHALVAPNGDDSDGDGLPDWYEQTIIDSNLGDTVDGLDDVMGTGEVPAVTDFDGDGADDRKEREEGTDPLNRDSDDDGLWDGVESKSGIFRNAGDTGTDPLDADSDDDGTSDGVEVLANTDPNDSSSNLVDHLLAIDFNRGDVLGAPSQSRFRALSGSSTQGENPTSLMKQIGGIEVTVSRPDSVALEFRGANSDSSRTIPGGDTSRSYLVADFIGSRGGALDLTFANLPAGDYIFRSYHLDSFTGTGLGFAQGATSNNRNTIEARIEGDLKASVKPNGLGDSGLGTTVINDGQIPTLSFAFSHDGLDSLVINFTAMQSNAGDSHLLLNGFEIFQINTP